jgi:O-antigen biosynthesis protein
MIKFIIKKALSNNRIHNYLRDAYGSAKQDTAISCSIAIQEITKFEFIKENDNNQTRINLFVPALSEKHVFGGIATALRFFKELLGYFPQARIIVTDETICEIKNAQFYSDWDLFYVGDEDKNPKFSIVVSGNRVGKKLFIRERDIFLTTSWWTYLAAYDALNFQKNNYEVKNNKIIYFVQDYEPGFYAWSSRYALAESTYKKPELTIPVFNTKLLYNFFENQGYQFKHSFYFNPLPNPELMTLRNNFTSVKKEKQILIYGRPSVSRNLFELIVESLKYWVQSDPDSKNWKILSAGELHENIPLGPDVMLESVGKLTIEQYANVLSRSDIGLSLMLSPHPSYPPLEMSMFGMKVITNNYQNKQLENLVSGVFTPSSLMPQDIAKQIEQLTKNFGVNIDEIYQNDIFSEDTVEFPFVSDVVKCLELIDD